MDEKQKRMLELIADAATPGMEGVSFEKLPNFKVEELPEYLSYLDKLIKQKLGEDKVEGQDYIIRVLKEKKLILLFCSDPQTVRAMKACMLVHMSGVSTEEIIKQNREQGTDFFFFCMTIMLDGPPDDIKQ